MNRALFGLHGDTSSVLHELGRETVELRTEENAADLPSYRGFLGLTEPGSGFN
jgi:hypothetical protein